MHKDQFNDHLIQLGIRFWQHNKITKTNRPNPGTQLTNNLMYSNHNHQNSDQSQRPEHPTSSPKRPNAFPALTKSFRIVRSMAMKQW